MARIFLSHSSIDKEFVRKLADDLRELGHRPWLDEWEIRVGECIVTRIQEGLSATDYVVLVLTPEAIESGWVEREWKDAYWTEIGEKRVVVLPILLRTCEVPPLLRTKKYADFTKPYEIGLAQLSQSILPPQFEQSSIDLGRESLAHSRITDLLSKALGRGQPLSQSIADALSLAHDRGDADLASFCSREVAGWGTGDDLLKDKDALSYRSFPIFVSLGYLNPASFAWSGSASSVFAYMERNPHNFFPRRTLEWRPLAQIESLADSRPASSTSYLRWTQPLRDINPDTDTPDAKVYCYAHADAYHAIIDAVRAELTKRLVRLLPAVSPSPRHPT